MGEDRTFVRPLFSPPMSADPTRMLLERNIRLLIAYDGTAYAGWQRQAQLPTIQGVIEGKIALMTRGKALLHGAGRTDAGVHALGMVANFQTQATIPCQGFVKGMNSLLPRDIRILAADEVSADFHARFQAKGKRYSYHVSTQPTLLPHQRLYSAHFPGTYDFSSMQAALDSILGEHDFSSFEATGSRDLTIASGRGAVRRIFSSTLCHHDKTMIISIHGDGFLRHMVRNIAGTVLEVGQGKRSVTDFIETLEACDRAHAGPTAPAQGLFLDEVFY